MRAFASLLLGLSVAAAATDKPDHAAHRQPQVLAPGYSSLAFTAPAPGTYALPPLGRAADGKLLDTNGRSVTLHEIFDGKIVVLSFIYTSCPDVNGCPLASFVLRQLQERLGSESDGVRLVSVSFDPANDTPKVMREYAARFTEQPTNWRFLTAANDTALAPILEHYDQSVIRQRDADGNLTNTMSHILRVYLVDGEGRIRNIYSPAFLHSDLLLADIRTVRGDGTTP